MSPALLLAGIAVYLLLACLKLVPEYERAVIFRLGRLKGMRGPGLIFLIPFIEHMRRVDMRTITMDVPLQDIVTRDDILVKVDAVVYFKVVDPVRALSQVENYLYAMSELAQVDLRRACGEYKYHALLKNREAVSSRLQHIFDDLTDPWGIKVSRVEIKRIERPTE